ncbi:50S ribosome-binding GTPase [bacterium]|nr:50S ribosome-binding GTPase [bacterium]
MPANLPPQYFETEKKLKSAKSPEEKKEIMEELLSIVPKHKGTEKIQAQLKSKISKLKDQIQKKPKTASHGPTYHIEKAGAGQVVLIGPPNAGKSSLIASLTNAEPEIQNYPFTTPIPFPAMMEYKNVQIQLIDTPPIMSDYIDTWHHELVKGADGVLLVIDLSNPHLEKDIYTVLEKLRENRVEIVTQNQQGSDGARYFYSPSLVVANKNDHPSAQKNLFSPKKTFESQLEFISVSTFKKTRLEELKEKIFKLLNVLRVYSKTPGKKVDYNEPFVFKKGSSVMDMAETVHRDFARKLKYARIWGKDKYKGQKVNREYILQDEDIIELHI